MGPALTEGPTQVPTELTFVFFMHSKRITPSDARERVNDGKISPCPFLKGQRVRRRHENIVTSWLPRSIWNKFIAAIRAVRNFRLVFFNFWYYSWGQHRCWTETSTIGNDFLLMNLHCPQLFYYLPLPYRCSVSVVKLTWSKKWNVCYITEIILNFFILSPGMSKRLKLSGVLSAD